MTSESVIGGTPSGQAVRWVSIDELRLDPANPRLEDEHADLSQEELAVVLDELYDAKDIAKSIARFGYFPSEVLVGVESSDGIVIVEGNRRLTAVKGLADAALRANLGSTREWDRIATSAAGLGHVPSELPVLVAPDRNSVMATVGYRHISGIKAWEPYQQARYVAQRVEDDALTFREVAQQTGISETEVRNKYRNYRITQAAQEAGVDPALIQESFGVWDNAMGRVALRRYIGAPDPSAVSPTTEVIPEEFRSRLRELVDWIFGPNRVISESRQLGDLAQVLASPAATARLVAGDSLADALAAVHAPQSPIARGIAVLTSALNGAKVFATMLDNADEDEYAALTASPELRQLTTELLGTATALDGQVNEP